MGGEVGRAGRNIRQVDTAHQPLDGRLHALLLRTLIDEGAPAPLPRLAEALGADEPDIEASMRRLEANHGVVLHPGTLEPWVIHPFSTTPTLFYLTSDPGGWWAPCIWCALGAAILVGPPVTISTVMGGETEPLTITVTEGGPDRPDLLAHFPIPVARAWDNVHRHCASTLVFETEGDIDRWCARHGIEKGEVVPLGQVHNLARDWYGGHLDPEWRKATADEAQAVFRKVGLTAPHWDVPGGSGRF